MIEKIIIIEIMLSKITTNKYVIIIICTTEI